MNDILHADDPAAQRYRQLVAALGEEPFSAAETGVLARVAAWTAPHEVETLAALIARARGRAAARHHALLAEVADLLPGPFEVHETTDEVYDRNGLAGYQPVIPLGLAQRIKEAAK